MQPLRLKAYLLTMLSLVLLRVLDLFLTYLYIPDLGTEYNPVVSVLGASWSTFLLVQGLMLALLASVGYVYFRLRDVEVSLPGLGFFDFMHCYLFGRLVPWRERIMIWPLEFRPHVSLVCFMLLSVSILASLVAIANNAALLAGMVGYSNFLRLHYPLFIPALYLALTLFCFFLFFLRRYRRYLRT